MVSIESSMSFRIATWINFHCLPKNKVNPYMFTNLPSVVYMLYSFFLYLVRFCMNARHSLYFVCFCTSTGYFYFDFFVCALNIFIIWCTFCMSVIHFHYLAFFVWVLYTFLILSTSACILEIFQRIFCCSILYKLLHSPLFYTYYYIIKGKGEMFCKIHVCYGHSHCKCDQSGVT